MKTKIIPLYDVLLYAIICGPLIISSLLILFFGQLNDFDWICQHWYLVVLFAVGIGVPMGGLLLVRYCEFQQDTVFFFYFPWTTSWKKAVDNIDISWNQNTFLSEIANVEIVKLTKEEKKSKVYWKHWFNKYLKISLKCGGEKYVYVANYSKDQIQQIIKLLTAQSEQTINHLK